MHARLKVDSFKLYDSEWRQKALSTVDKELEKDARIIGALIVGSGAVGFKDDYSDLDIAILVEEKELDKVYADWETKIQELFHVIDHFTLFEREG